MQPDPAIVKIVAWNINHRIREKAIPDQFVIIGDFNTDPKYPRSRCGDRIKRLVNDGWQLAAPPDGSSFWTLNGDAVRIDHAFASRLLSVNRAAYVAKSDGHVFVGKEPGALSDHAALSVDITLREP